MADKQWTKQSLQTLKDKVNTLKGLQNLLIQLIGSSHKEGVGNLIEKEIEDRDRVREDLNKRPKNGRGVNSKHCDFHLKQMHKIKADTLLHLERRIIITVLRRRSYPSWKWKRIGRSSGICSRARSTKTRVYLLSIILQISYLYLASLLLQPTTSMIAEFTLMAASYETAVLKKRYGKDIVIERMHVNNLLQLPPV